MGGSSGKGDQLTTLENWSDDAAIVQVARAEPRVVSANDITRIKAITAEFF